MQALSNSKHNSRTAPGQPARQRTTAFCAARSTVTSSRRRCVRVAATHVPYKELRAVAEKAAKAGAEVCLMKLR